MKKVKTFLHVFVNSLIPQVNYYPKILHTKLAFSLQYYLFLLLTLNAVFLISLPFKYFPLHIDSAFDSVITSLQSYPDDLNINITGNRMTTNYNRPYFMWYDFQNQKSLLAVVDESGSVQDSGLKPLLLLTSNQLVINTGQNSPDIISLNNLKITSINKQKIDQFAATLTIIRRLLPFIALGLFIILIFLVPLGSLIINTIYIFIASLIGYVLFNFFYKKHKIHYEKSFQIALHAITLPLLIDYFLIIFRPTIYTNNNGLIHISASLPILFIILLLVFVFGGIYEAHAHHINAGK